MTAIMTGYWTVAGSGKISATRLSNDDQVLQLAYQVHLYMIGYMEKFCTLYAISAEIKKSMKLLCSTVVLHREIMEVRDFFSQNITLNIILTDRQCF